MNDTISPSYFGEWLKRRRKALDLTQNELAKRANCTVFALRKIEAGDRRPSKQLAALLARSLEIPTEEQINFIKAARGNIAVDRLAAPAHSSLTHIRPDHKPGSTLGNLPGMMTAFLGREPELNALNRLLHDPQCRLLTLVGLGGIGKTRLAIEAANRNKDIFPEGVWFVSLDPLISAVQLIPALANALNFRFQDPSQQLAQLLNYLREKRVLLVLDNADRLLNGFEIIEEILRNTCCVKLLVTSRERLNLQGEWVFDIQGLPVPSNDQADQFEACSSVALFLQSARRTCAGFELQEDDRRWVLNICQRLEGIPLGVQLAAAWVELLSCKEIAKEIEANLDFLTTSMRDLPERHRSLRASLDYSWKLLNSEEKLVLSRLSVFEGHFRLNAAKAVCGASLPVLSALKNKTLLNRTDQEFYSLHPLVKQYTAMKLAEDPDEEERVKGQHAFYYAQHLSQWEKALKSSQQVEILKEMAEEIDNLRQAWQWMISHFPNSHQANNPLSPRLYHNSLFSLSLFYELRYRNWEAIHLFAESVERLQAFRDVQMQLEDVRGFESVLGHITAYLGLHQSYILQYKQACERLNEALRLLMDGPSRIERAQVQVMLAAIHLKQGQIQNSIHLLEQSCTVFREEGDVWWYPLALIHLAGSYLMLGKIPDSLLLYQEGLQFVEPGDLRLKLPLQNGIAYARYLQSDYVEAEQLLQDNLPLSVKLGFDRQIALVYLYLGQVALITNRIELAEQYIQKSIDLFSLYGESNDLALGLLYSGKCRMAGLEIDTAQNRFREVIRIGLALDMIYLVFWGLVNFARAFMIEGQTEKALQIMLVLQKYPVEYKEAQDDSACLLAGLRAMLPEQQVEAIQRQVEGMSFNALLKIV